MDQERVTRRTSMQQNMSLIQSRKRQSVINEIDVDRFMREDFEPTRNFGIEMAGGGEAGFRAKKSKTRIVPDKSQIYSLADLMNNRPPEQLQIP
jgi:hypothetical protein